MLSTSLIQFSADGWGCVPFLWFGLRPDYSQANGSNDHLLQKDLCQNAGPPRTVVVSAPDTWQATVNPHLHQRLLDSHRQVWLSLLRGPAPFSWVLVHTSFCCAFQESCFPVHSQPFGWIPSLGNLLWALELLQQCEDFFGVIVLVCGSSARCLCGGANGDFLQEDLGHMPRRPGLLQLEPLSFWQATADSCLRRRHSNTRRQVWPSLLMG